MFCIECGKKSKDSENNCSRCGISLTKLRKKSINGSSQKVAKESLESASIQKCRNCGSMKLLAYICTDCFENVEAFDTPDSIARYMDELTELVPELSLVDSSATLEEAQSAAEHQDLEARMTARYSEYKLSRLDAVMVKLNEARMAQSNNPEDSHLQAIVAITFMGVFSIWAAFASPVTLVFTIPVSLIIFFSNFIFCRECKKFLKKKHSLLRTNVLEEKFGSHTEHSQVNTSTQNYDSRGKASGFSSSTTYVPYHVQHVDQKAEYLYGCNFCGNVWGLTRVKRFNLS